jgi:hypothetical protein
MENTIKVEMARAELVAAVAEHIIEKQTPRWDTDDDGTPIERANKAAIAKRVDELLSASVVESIDEMVKARVGPVVEATLAAGFPQRNQYGEPTGTSIPYDAFVRTAVQQLVGSGGGYNQRGWAAEIARDVWKERIDKALTAEMDGIRKQIRAYVDERLAGDVTAALRKAVGL